MGGGLVYVSAAPNFANRASRMFSGTSHAGP